MTSKPNAKIVFITGGGPLYWIIANALVERFGPIIVIREEAEPKGLFLKRRMKRLGVITVAGQVAFSFLSKVISKRSERQRKAIVASAGANTGQPAGCEIIDVVSVNSAACRQALQAIKPDAVMVVGARIIKKETLSCIDAPFINYHPGITPKYRGMNGAYWTLATGDAENLGVTMHLVDESVDTGDVLYQERCAMPPDNNITTYHHVLAVAARPLAVKAIEDAVAGKLIPRKVHLPSFQWYHPTLWGYLWTGITRRVW
ncbi:MAG: formyl transferase [Rhizobiales bacterium]|nr:formyl transferase [Hyphomicrobiales bacterium]